jgi:hypothetical protein
MALQMLPHHAWDCDEPQGTLVCCPSLRLLAEGFGRVERFAKTGSSCVPAVQRHTATMSDATSKARFGTLQQKLGLLGWSNGRNTRIDYRWAAGDPDNLRKYAAELVALAPDVVMANGSAAAALLLQA